MTGAPSADPPSPRSPSLKLRPIVPILLCLAVGVARAAGDSASSAAPGPRLLVPPPANRADTLESEPAPLLRPGRGSPDDTVFTRRSARARELFEAGISLERQGASAAAIASYRNALKIDPRLRGPNLRIARLFVSAGQHGEAAKSYAAELMLDPTNAVVARELGLAQARSGDAREAIRTLGTLTRRRPSDGDAWRALGFAFMAARRPREAESALRQAIALPPERAEEHRDLGALLAQRGAEAEARTHYRRAIALDPRDPGVWVNLGNLERRAGRPDEAMRDYAEAERRDSTLSLAYQGQVQVLADARRPADAGEVYRRWVRASPRDYDARLEAVRYFDGLGRKDVALEIARDGVRRDERSSQAHLILGMALAGTGGTRAALAELRKAEGLATDTGQRDRARQMVVVLRGDAPDSLRAMFDADSVAHPERR